MCNLLQDLFVTGEWSEKNDAQTLLDEDGKYVLQKRLQKDSYYVRGRHLM